MKTFIYLITLLAITSTHAFAQESSFQILWTGQPGETPGFEGFENNFGSMDMNHDGIDELVMLGRDELGNPSKLLVSSGFIPDSTWVFDFNKIDAVIPEWRSYQVKFLGFHNWFDDDLDWPTLAIGDGAPMGDGMVIINPYTDEVAESFHPIAWGLCIIAEFDPNNGVTEVAALNKTKGLIEIKASK